MKKQGFVPQLLQLIQRREDQKGQTVEFAYVAGRRPVGSSGATYTVVSRGASISGVSAQLGDYEPGQRIMLSRFGKHSGEARQVLMQSPPSKQATQAPQSWQRDITNDTLL